MNDPLIESERRELALPTTSSPGVRSFRQRRGITVAMFGLVGFMGMALVTYNLWAAWGFFGAAVASSVLVWLGGKFAGRVLLGYRKK